MNSREQTLALLLLGLITLTVAGAVGYFFVLGPIAKARNDELALGAEIADLEKQFNAQRQNSQRLKVAQTRSLPADPALARREYVVALERLIEAAGVPKGYTISPKAVDNSPRFVPELSKGKPIYTRVAFELVFKKADMWAVQAFLEGYYKLGVLHQITAFNIKKDEESGAKNAGKRNDLTVTLTTEAIIIEGAEPRKTLLPVPTAFAAVGGGAIYKGLTLSPEAARGVQPEQTVPALSPVGRDYRLMVQKDPFHGPLPIETPPTPKPLKLATIRDVKVKSGEKSSPVRVSMTGDGANTATFTAIAAGNLFAEGALKVDPKNYAIELPTVEASEGTATITVIATTADGKSTDKTTFKVSLEEVVVAAPTPKEDISPYVVLIGATPRSDGTAWARVKDNANRLRYEIEAKPKGVTVVKEWFVLEWKKDRDYEEAPGVLHITADGTSTNRTFKVVAIDAEGIIVSDLKPEGAAPAPSRPKGPGWPPKGQPKQGPGSPLAALGGNPIVAIPRPKMYRWEVGQPLSKLQEIPEEDARKILKQVEESGPVFDVAGTP
jgi:hypothetical protein